MAITPTGAIYKTLTFDGESSADYGVYITGQAVFNAPEREVEMITIPGRNGTFALDKGRFENVTVTYPAGIFADTDEDFSEAISDFRNWLCSRQGYVRLEDDYNPNEYRLAVYKSGLEVELAQLKAGEFNIVFECKPQRFLKSGEEDIEIDGEDTITNPTLFDAKPLLKVTGHGNLRIGDYLFKINECASLGNYKVYDTAVITPNKPLTISRSLTSVQDPIAVGSRAFFFSFEDLNETDFAPVTNITTTATEYSVDVSPSAISVNATFGSASFSAGTSSTQSASIAFDLHAYGSGGTMEAVRMTCSCILAKNAVDKMTMEITYTLAAVSGYNQLDLDLVDSTQYCRLDDVTVTSTRSLASETKYIDLDIGEAYLILGDQIVNLNKYIYLGADLPVLHSGSTTIEGDSTITTLLVEPRWWII